MPVDGQKGSLIEVTCVMGRPGVGGASCCAGTGAGERLASVRLLWSADGAGSRSDAPFGAILVPHQHPKWPIMATIRGNLIPDRLANSCVGYLD
jgi:hypothetical protein